MFIKNQTSVPIQCIVDAAQSMVLQPGAMAEMDIQGPSVNMKLTHMYTSRVCKLFAVEHMKVIVCNCAVALSQLSQDSVCTVTGELVHFTYGYAYDRLYCCCKDCCLEGQTLMPTESEKFYQEAVTPRDSTFSRVLDYFFDGVFGAAVYIFLLVKLGCWLGEKPFSWWWLPIFLAAGYGIQILMEKFVNTTIRKGYSWIGRKPSVRCDLEKFMSDAYIGAYFNNSSRQWVGNDQKPL